MNAMKKIGNRKSEIGNSVAFTLIELLVVISIIGILAAFSVPVLSGIKRQAYINKTKAEMETIKTAIERYKAAYGFYPPGNPNNLLLNQLYYELEGTTNNATTGIYRTLDGSSTIPTAQVNPAFGNSGVNGFMNCSKAGAGEDAPLAKNFLSDLKASQIFRQYTNNTPPSPVGVDLLVASVGGPYQGYQPLGNNPGPNPWRYNSSSPTNNPGSYDLYVQLVIKPGQTNLICNWTKQVQVNSPLP